jgi:aromatic ring-opening dioxygenase catalytic subunit (LigB family)
MAEIVAAMAMTHSPGLTGWFDRAPEDQRLQARRALDEMRERLRAARPDVVVLFSNDHLLNWPINNTPEYTVGIGPEHVGPADWYDAWLALAKYRIPGRPALARYLVNEGARRRLAFAYLRDMQFDDGVSVPMHYLNPDGDIPLVPVTMNCTVPPLPTPERAYQVGTTLHEMIRAYPGGERVAVLLGGRGVRSVVPRAAEAGRSRDGRPRVHARAHGSRRLGRYRGAARVDPRARVHDRSRRGARLPARDRLAIGNRHGGLARCQELTPPQPSSRRRPE